MDQETLYRYMKHRSTAREREQIADWLESNPRHRETLDRMSIQMETLSLLAPDLDAQQERMTRHRNLRGRLLRWSAAAAAAVVLCAGLWHASRWSARQELGSRTLAFQTQNAPVRCTLSDGTRVWLNAGTRLEYPAAFTGRERRVRIAGEALFEVEHDDRHPFIVETFACEVEVTGTRFNVLANQSTGTFATALLEGSVRLTNKRTGERLTMQAEDLASLHEGRLRLGRIRSHDDYLWTEGILNIGGCTFTEVIARLEKTYGVRIVVERSPAPTLDVARGKLWTSMGLDYALRTLQTVATFRYERDEQTNTIFIR